MVRNDVYFTGVEGLVNSEIYHDFVLAKVGCTSFVDDCPEYEIMLREDDKMEENYRDLLLGILTERENKMTRKRSRSKAKIKLTTNAKVSNEGENEKTEKVTRMESNCKASNRKVETVNSSTNDRAWDEYRKKFKNNEEHNQEKENGDDESSADVEILDSTPFEEGKTNSCLMNKKMGPTKKRSEFRQKVIAFLRRPYDEDESGRLWVEFELRTPDPNHRDRSYHDYYPDLARKLEQFEDDQPRCLNLLRGLFFWLQNSMQIGSFQPWQDAECLAVKPDSR